MPIDRTIYNYSATTREYLSIGEADLSPADLKKSDPIEVLMIPAFATPIEPPSTIENQVAVFDPELETWSVQQDYRGQVRYSTITRLPMVINEIGPLPENTTATPPPENYTWNQNEMDWVLSPELVAAANNAIVYQELKEIDLQSIAPIREWIAAQPGVSSEITTLEQQYIDKKAELDLAYED